MKVISRSTITMFILILTALSLIGCASAPMTAADSGGDSSGEMMAASEAVEEAEFQAEALSNSDADGAEFADESLAREDRVPTSGLGDRKIIREATLRIEAEDVTTALNQATVLSVRVGGYTTGSNSWQERDNWQETGNRLYASLSFAVPVERFEEALEQTRRLGKVTSENTTSQDVTSQYVDLEARITNLEATAERLRTFLGETSSVKNLMEVNRELSRVEGDLESLKGQRNALAQRTSFSTIHLDIVPPPVVPTTTEVLEGASAWSPASTFNAALAILLDALRATADVAIWVVVVGLPFVLIASVAWVILRRVLGRFFTGRVSGSAPATSEASA